jgi:hypothetical protein
MLAALRQTPVPCGVQQQWEVARRVAARALAALDVALIATQRQHDAGRTQQRQVAADCARSDAERLGQIGNGWRAVLKIGLAAQASQALVPLGDFAAPQQSLFVVGMRHGPAHVYQFIRAQRAAKWRITAGQRDT